MDFIDRKVSSKKAIALLARKNIQINDDEAEVILDFLYLMAKMRNRKMALEDAKILKEKSN